MKAVSVAIAVALSVVVAPSAQAKTPHIVVTNHSKYLKGVDHQVLSDYLDKVSEFWGVYQGTYYIRIVDKLPSNVWFPKNAIGGHITGAIAYILGKETAQSGLDPYFVITHELAEMAVDPNLNFYENKGDTPKLIEVCDNLFEYFVLDNHQVANFHQPPYYTQEVIPEALQDSP